MKNEVARGDTDDVSSTPAALLATRTVENEITKATISWGGGKQGMDVTIMRSLGYVERCTRQNISYLDKHDPREKCRKQRLASKDRGAKPVDLFDENQIDEKTEEWKDGSSNYSKETQTTTVPTTLACRVFLPDFTEASFFRIKKCRIKTKRMLTN